MGSRVRVRFSSKKPSVPDTNSTHAHGQIGSNYMSATVMAISLS